MDPSGGGGLDARRLLEIAEKLLDARDLVGSKRFAERALESDPLLEGLDQTLAIADVLLASQRRLAGNSAHPDPYAVLQLPRRPAPDPLSVKRSFRRLSLLLDPARSRSPLASPALRSVADAYALLSDPARRSALDADISRHLASNGSDAADGPAPVRTFWTGCPSCCHVFEYDRLYAGRRLRCGNCRESFRGKEMAGRPPLVPGTDMYYCAWGFFPLGFRGAGFLNSGAVELPEFGEGWRPFVPVKPVWGERPLDAVPVNCAAGSQRKKGGAATAAGRNRKAVAKKRVGSYAKKRGFAAGSEGVEAATTTTTTTGMGISQFDIDLDATEDVLGNLQNLPFL